MVPTLEELEHDKWPDPPKGTTYLIATCHALRKKPVGTMTAEDLRILVGQTIGLRHLLPRVVDMLERDPLVSGDFYPGDLLGVTLSLDESVWRAQPELRDRFATVLGSAAIEEGDLIVGETVQYLVGLRDEWLARHGR